MALSHRRPRQVPVSMEPDTGSKDVETGELSRAAQRDLAVLRAAYGLTFLWAFFDRLLGLEYDTPGGNAWIDPATPGDSGGTGNGSRSSGAGALCCADLMTLR